MRPFPPIILTGWMISCSLRCLAQQPEDSVTIRVTVAEQRLDLFIHDQIEASWPVSTSEYGPGNKEGSNKTPVGKHAIAGKYGAGAQIGAIFEARKPTGKIAIIHTDSVDVPEDFITTRILWLRGLEPNINQGKGVDSYKRFIYIHGTPEEGLIGRPASHGCIRMKNRDIIELYERVSTGITVEIIE